MNTEPNPGTVYFYQPQRVDNCLVLNSAINHHILSNTRHHAANTRHIVQTNQRINSTLNNCDRALNHVEKNFQNTSLDLDSYVDSLSLCTATTCKTAMTRSRIMITDVVAKEKAKEKMEKEMAKSTKNN